MTNTLNKIMHDGDEYLLPEWFTPDNAWTTWQVLTKTADGYEYANAPVTSVNSNTWAVTVSEFSPTSSGSQWQVLTKWASGYDWANPTGWSSTITVTLASASWSSKSITVSATGVTASNTVIVSPAPSNINDYALNSVYCSAQGSGTLTFSCNTEPTVDIDVNVLIMS